MSKPSVEVLDVVCICGGYGYPTGTASAARITMVGRTLQQAGFRFRLIHCGPSPVPINNQRSGTHEGIDFEYITSVRRPESRGARILLYALGLLRLSLKLIQLRPRRRRTVIYLYAMDGILNIFAARLCCVLGLPMVQELCEWPPGEKSCSALTRWLYRGPIFKKATGVLAISKEIERRVRQICVSVRPELLVHRLPAIFDFRQYPATSAPCPEAATPRFVYCGTWLRDIYFLVEAMAHLKRTGRPGVLVLIGAYEDALRKDIFEFAASKGLPAEDIEFTGHVDEPTLHAVYRSAFSLLMPLPDDDRSSTRLPNKMAEYLASGRPVITARIGDVTEMLADGVSAYIAEPGDIESFAGQMAAALNDPAKADRIGAAGQAEGIRLLDFRSHVAPLGDFFWDCCDWHEELRLRARASSLFNRGQSIFRNLVFMAAALVFMALGCVYRTRKQIGSSGLVTALYFHNPNSRLFERCVQWLKTHGYVFISAEDLLQYLYGRKTLPNGSVWLSFDDGYKEFMTGVLPLAVQLNLPVTLFVPSGIVEGNGLMPWIKHAKHKWGDVHRLVDMLSARDAITVEDLDRLSRFPEVTLGSHTAFHLRVTELSEERLATELTNSKRSLELYSPGPVTIFSYPESRFSGHEKDALVRAGYLVAVTDENKFISRNTDPYYVPRLCIPDQISFPEAICRMVGIWRPVINPVKNVIIRCTGRPKRRITVAEAQTPLH